VTVDEPLTRPWWLLPPGRIAPAWWVAIILPMLAVEWATGLYMQFPLIYVIPVCLAAYYSGRWPGLILALGIPIVHFAFAMIDQQAVNVLALIGTTIMRGAVIAFMALWFARLSEHERTLQVEVETLKGLLPICSFCKNIRNDAGEWERLEGFLSRRSQTRFSHAICPACHDRHYPSLPPLANEQT
jgi:hypothetical protein